MRVVLAPACDTGLPPQPVRVSLRPERHPARYRRERARCRSGQTGGMPWLVSQDRVFASVEVAGSPGLRARGLLGRDGVDGALWLPRTRSVHTVGMRFAIDVAYCDATGRVLAIVTMPPWRLGRPRLRARSVVEAQAGSLQRWGIAVGTVLEVKD